MVPELPSEDPELGLEEYADTIERALGDADDVVLVPHSLGGLVGPVIAARRPLRALVYLTALVPEPASASATSSPRRRSRSCCSRAGARSMTRAARTGRDPEATARIMYGDLSPEDARWAAERLRPQAQKSQTEPSPAPPPGCAWSRSSARATGS